MDKKSNMKQAMHEMFGVGKGGDAPQVNEKKTDAKPAAPAASAAPAAPAEPKKAAPTPPPAPEPPAASILAKGTAFEGTLKAKGDVEIAGEFKGNITTEGAVRLRSNIESSINAKSVELLGCVLTGDINVSGTATVGEGSKVVGNVTAKELLCAGDVAGDLKIGSNVRLDAKARICGNITTGAISVEEGAGISGNVQIHTRAEAKA